MDLKALLPLVAQGSILLLVLALGLRATPYDALWVLRRPGLLFRSVLAILVVVPAFATFLAWALPLPSVVKLAMVLMAVSPLPPLVPGKQLKFGGDVSYVCGLLASVSLLSVITVPLTLAILSAMFPADAFVPAAALAKLAAVTVILPLGVGMTVHRLRPALARRAAPVVSALANITLVVVLVPVLVATAPAIWALVGNGAVFAIAAVVLVGLAAGHVLGGPDPDNRTALAFATAIRHPGIAMLIGRVNFASTHILGAVLLFTIVGMLGVVPYEAWRKRRLKDAADARVADAPAPHAVIGRTR